MEIFFPKVKNNEMFGKLPFKKKKKVVFQAHKGLKTRQDI